MDEIKKAILISELEDKYEQFKMDLANVRNDVRQEFAPLIADAIAKKGGEIRREFAVYLVDSPLTGAEKRKATSSTAWDRWKALIDPAGEVLAVRKAEREESERVFDEVTDAKEALYEDFHGFFESNSPGRYYDADKPWVLARVTEDGDAWLWLSSKKSGAWSPVAVLPGGAELDVGNLRFDFPVEDARALVDDLGEEVAKAAQNLM